MMVTVEMRKVNSKTDNNQIHVLSIRDLRSSRVALVNSGFELTALATHPPIASLPSTSSVNNVDTNHNININININNTSHNPITLTKHKTFHEKSMDGEQAIKDEQKGTFALTVKPCEGV